MPAPRKKPLNLAILDTVLRGDVSKARELASQFESKDLSYNIVDDPRRHNHTPILTAVREYCRIYSPKPGQFFPDRSNDPNDYYQIVKLLINIKAFKDHINTPDIHRNGSSCTALHYAVYEMTDSSTDAGRKAALKLAVLLRRHGATSNTLGDKQREALKIIDNEVERIKKETELRKNKAINLEFNEPDYKALTKAGMGRRARKSYNREQRLLAELQNSDTVIYTPSSSEPPSTENLQSSPESSLDSKKVSPAKKSVRKPRKRSDHETLADQNAVVPVKKKQTTPPKSLFDQNEQAQKTKEPDEVKSLSELISISEMISEVIATSKKLQSQKFGVDNLNDIAVKVTRICGNMQLTLQEVKMVRPILENHLRLNLILRNQKSSFLCFKWNTPMLELNNDFEEAVRVLNKQYLSRTFLTKS